MDFWESAGGVVFDQTSPGFICIIKPSNNYGPWCLPKGRIDTGESQSEAALREVKEETGVIAKITPGGYLGSYKGSYSITHYYVMEKVSETGKHDSETEEVKFIYIDEAIELFKQVGNNRDHNVLINAKNFYEKNYMNNAKDKNKELNEGSSATLNEIVQLNLMGKIFFATCAAWLVGKVTNMKVRGTKREIEVLQNAMLSSKRFQEELKKPGATVESVVSKLQLKNASAAQFQKILGIPWPL
jgi:8-oxo-dGTP pyrophosphatase MutT (NUDIX family)